MGMISWCPQRCGGVTQLLLKWKFCNRPMEFFLNGPEISLNSGNLPCVSCWHCGTILVSYTRGGRFENFHWHIFLALNSLNSEKTFRKNCIKYLSSAFANSSHKAWHMCASHNDYGISKFYLHTIFIWN